MRELCAELLDEYDELAGLADDLTPSQWATRTDFHGWTPWDEVAHLCYFDATARQSIEDPAAFVRDARVLRQRMQAGEQISAIARAHYSDLDGRALLARWRGTYPGLVEALATRDAKARLDWYGPMMSARSFASARLMETWAHGQDVWDALGRKRPATPRLRHVAHLGVSTFGWTFVNRGLEPPAQAPFVELIAPGGETWRWGDPAASDRVQGSAEDFCLLVTQRRNLADTRLICQGDGAKRWAAMAQCFAGAPADPPAAGVRRSVA